MAGLNGAQVRFICDHVVHRKDWSVSRIAIQYDITPGRVRQLVSAYRMTRTYPVLKKSGRKASPPTRNSGGAEST